MLRYLEKARELLRANSGRFEINSCYLQMIQHYIEADSAEKLCELERSEFDRVCERRKLRVYVRKSKVIKRSRYVNVGRMNVRLNDNR